MAATMKPRIRLFHPTNATPHMSFLFTTASLLTKEVLVYVTAITKNILAFGEGLGMDVVAKRLREARTQAGLSQERLGVLAGIDEMSASARMNQYERGKHAPDFGTVVRIAAVLNVPPAYFYAVTAGEAHLLVKFHRMTRSQRAKVIAVVDEMS